MPTSGGVWFSSIKLGKRTYNSWSIISTLDMQKDVSTFHPIFQCSQLRCCLVLWCNGCNFACHISAIILLQRHMGREWKMRRRGKKATGQPSQSFIPLLYPSNTICCHGECGIPHPQSALWELEHHSIAQALGTCLECKQGWQSLGKNSWEISTQPSPRKITLSTAKREHRLWSLHSVYLH